MLEFDKNLAESKAREALAEVYRAQNPRPSTAEERAAFLRRLPWLVARHWGYSVSQSKFLSGATAHKHGRMLGRLSVPDKSIGVATFAGSECTRFSLAHELGHVAMDRDTVKYEIHREMVPGAARGRVEERADWFAGALLMPLRASRDFMMSTLGGAIDIRTPSPLLSHLLNTATGPDASECRDPKTRTVKAVARLVAQAESRGDGMPSFPSFMRYFGVSRDAAAIRLEQLGWIFDSSRTMTPGLQLGVPNDRQLVSSEAEAKVARPITSVVASRKARIFIGSSTEGLGVAYAVQQELDHDAEPVIWTQGVFGRSGITITDLIRVAKWADFAVFVFTPDDRTLLRGASVSCTRDNVLFEYGMFLSELGLQRVFFLTPRGVSDFHLPSDLNGVNPLTYDPKRDNLRAAVGAGCSDIRQQVARLGLFERAPSLVAM